MSSADSEIVAFCVALLLGLIGLVLNILAFGVITAGAKISKNIVSLLLLTLSNLELVVVAVIVHSLRLSHKTSTGGNVISGDNIANLTQRNGAEEGLDTGRCTTLAIMVCFEHAPLMWSTSCFLFCTLNQ